MTGLKRAGDDCEVDESESDREDSKTIQANESPLSVITRRPGRHVPRTPDDPEKLGANAYFKLRDSLKGPEQTDQVATEQSFGEGIQPTGNSQPNTRNDSLSTNKRDRRRVSPLKHRRSCKKYRSPETALARGHDRSDSNKQKAQLHSPELLGESERHPGDTFEDLAPLNLDRATTSLERFAAEPVRRTTSASDIPPSTRERTNNRWVVSKGKPANHVVTIGPDYDVIQTHDMGQIPTPMLETVKTKLKVWSWRKGVGHNLGNGNLLQSIKSEKTDCSCDETTSTRSSSPERPDAPPNTAHQSGRSSIKEANVQTLVHQSDHGDDDDDDDEDEDRPIELSFRYVLPHHSRMDMTDTSSDRWASFRRRSLSAPIGITHRLSNLAEEDTHFQSHRDSVQLFKRRKEARGVERLPADQLMNAKDSFILNKSRLLANGLKKKKSTTIAEVIGHIEYTDPVREDEQLRNYQWPPAREVQHEV